MSIPQPYDTGLTEEQLAEAFRRALGDMTDEEIENAIATAISLIPKGLVYRGAYNYFSELPTNAKEGEVYTVKYNGTSGTEPDGNEYAWGEYEGTLQWIPLGVDSYTKKEIDEQNEEVKSDILNINALVTYCKNLIPQDVAIGYYADSTGAILENNSHIRAVNYPKVKPNTTYTISSNLPIYSVWYFNNDTALSRESVKENTRTITTPENCNNIRISLQKPSSSSGTSEFKWLQVEEGEVATEFVPYVPSLQNQINALVERITALENK